MFTDWGKLARPTDTFGVGAGDPSGGGFGAGIDPTAGGTFDPFGSDPASGGGDPYGWGSPGLLGRLNSPNVRAGRQILGTVLAGGNPLFGALSTAGMVTKNVINSIAHGLRTGEWPSAWDPGINPNAGMQLGLGGMRGGAGIGGQSPYLSSLLTQGGGQPWDGPTPQDGPGGQQQQQPTIPPLYTPFLGNSFGNFKNAPLPGTFEVR